MHDTKPRAKRVSRCQDIHRNLCAPPAAEETQIQNRQLRPARRSDFGLGRRSSVFSRSRNTNPREERVTRCKGSLLLKHRGGSHWKSTSQACAVEQFGPRPSIRLSAAVCAVQKGRGTIHIKQVSLESCWLLQYSA